MPSVILRVACLALLLCAVAASQSGEEAPSNRRRRRRAIPINALLIKRLAAVEKDMLMLRKELKKLKDIIAGGGGGGPKPEIAACKGKDEKEKCWFDTPDGKTKKGHCDGKEEPRWCKAMPGPGGPDKPKPRPEVEACDGKEEQETCSFDTPEVPSWLVKGLCQAGRCHALPGSPDKQEVEACMGKGEKRTCTFDHEGTSKRGECIGKEPMFCRVTSCKPACVRTGPKPEIAACMDKDENEKCLFVNPFGITMKGICFGKEGRWCRTPPRTTPKPIGEPRRRRSTGGGDEGHRRRRRSNQFRPE